SRRIEREERGRAPRPHHRDRIIATASSARGLFSGDRREGKAETILRSGVVLVELGRVVAHFGAAIRFDFEQTHPRISSVGSHLEVHQYLVDLAAVVRRRAETPESVLEDMTVQGE